MNSYATNNKQQHNIFFGNIELKLMQIKNKFPDAKIIWGGDFNCVHNDLLDRWPSKEDGMCEIKNVCLRLGLIDIWRYKNPNQLSYTWSNKDQSKQSHIDYFLISDALEMYVQSVSIEPSILTDHKGIAIYINVYGSSKYQFTVLLQRTVNTAAKIIGAPLPSILDIFLTRCSSKAKSIVEDPTHPSHSLFQLLPSGRRYRSIRARSARLLNSFFPQAVRALNSHHTAPL